MANLMQGVGQGFNDLIWGSLGNTLPIIVILLVIVLFFAGVFVLIWWKGFNIKVKIYEPAGQVPLDTEEQIEMKHEKDPSKLLKKLKEKKIKFNQIKYKRTHGKFATIKGSQYFVTFMPMRKLPPVPMTLLYDNGVHLVRLSRDIFVPVPKPDIELEIGQNVSLSVEEDIQWKVWNNMMADRINNKYQDLDAQKRIAVYFISGIVAIVLLGGFLLWLIYRLSTRGLIVADKFSSVVEGLLGGNPPS